MGRYLLVLFALSFLVACSEPPPQSGHLVCNNAITQTVDTIAVVNARNVHWDRSAEPPWTHIHYRDRPRVDIVGLCMWADLPAYIDGKPTGWTTPRVDPVPSAPVLTDTVATTETITDTVLVEVPVNPTPLTEKVYALLLVMFGATVCVGFIIWLVRQKENGNGN